MDHRLNALARACARCKPGTRTRTATIATALVLAGMACTHPACARAERQGADSGEVSGFQSAGQLLRKCRDASSYGKSYCYSYVAAVVDTARAYQTWLDVEELCLPASASQGLLVDTFEAYLVANPSFDKSQAASVVVTALQSRFPCGAASTSSSMQASGTAEKHD